MHACIAELCANADALKTLQTSVCEPCHIYGIKFFGAASAGTLHGLRGHVDMLTSGFVEGAMHRVLIVEDNHDLRDMLRCALEVQGYDVVDADGGRAGLCAIAEACPDIVLLDYSMPDINGAEVAKKVREVHDDLPIIFISANSSLAASAADAIPNADILAKPFFIDTLSHRIVAMLRIQ